MTDVVLLEVSERIATITLNRPEARNALSQRGAAAAAPAAARGRRPRRRRRDHPHRRRPGVLRRARPQGARRRRRQPAGGGADGAPTADAHRRGPFPALTKPVIGAVNGVAITGGFELALNCDFLVASERARFGDTHTRVGVMPGWGLTVLLPQAIGVRRAREMSFTGNFLDADEALQLGLVNHVVAPRRADPVHPPPRHRHHRQRPARRAPDPQDLRRRSRPATVGDGWDVERHDAT